jgi:hypothetical protein
LLCHASRTLTELPTALSVRRLGKYVSQWAQRLCCFVSWKNHTVVDTVPVSVQAPGWYQRGVKQTYYLGGDVPGVIWVL